MISKMVKQMFPFLTEDHLASADKSERASVAKAFNDRYTYRRQWKPMPPHMPERKAPPPIGYGSAWMCPECNSIHRPFHWATLDGVHFPECCSTPQGNRLDRNIRMRD